MDALRPPEDHEVGIAVGTTYTMHLEAALMAPAAFAIFSDPSGRRNEHFEPLTLIESLHRHSEKTTVFFQAGQASVPKKRRLFALMEEMLIPVTAPRGGVFHPKVWAVRFDKPEQNSLYRFICTSRNLTFDRSWDTVLVLESVDDESPSAQLSDLSQFIRNLPGLATTPLPKPREATINSFANELELVRGGLPAPFTDLRAHLFGTDHGKRVDTSFEFPGDAEKLLVVSPFLTKERLRKFDVPKEGSTLITEPQQINLHGATIDEQFGRVFQLAPEAIIADLEVPNPAPSADSLSGGELQEIGRPTFAGLHAKLFVFDHPAGTSIFTGSANATTAAFTKNVEILIELIGPTKTLGVDAILNPDATDSLPFFSFLIEVPRHRELEDSEDELDTDERRLLDEARRSIASLRIQSRATTRKGTEEPDNSYRLHFLSSESPQFSDQIEWKIRPLTQQPSQNLIMAAPSKIDSAFDVTFLEITSFLVHELKLGSESISFVTPTNLVEQPEDRTQRLYKELVGDANRFMAYLLLLLSDRESHNIDVRRIIDEIERPSANSSSAGFEAPLLEAMLRTLDRDPYRLTQVHQILAGLPSDESGDSFLPPEFYAAWDPIWDFAKGQSE